MTQNGNNQITKALKLLLKPVVRFCLSHSLKVQEVSELLKHAFLEVAAEEIKRQGALPSTSKVAAISGLQRRDVAKLVTTPIVEPSNVNLITRIIGQWRYDKRFLDSTGSPMTLQTGSKQSQFAELVRTVNKDINPYTVLFELERLNYVEQTSEGLRLTVAIHQAVDDVEESLGILASDVGDLIQAVDENTFRRELVPNLHLRTEYDGIPPAKVPELRKWILHEGTRFHRKIAEYIAAFDQDLNPPADGVLRVPSEECVRVVIGSFSCSGVKAAIGAAFAEQKTAVGETSR
jgi:hypothetical protein